MSELIHQGFHAFMADRDNPAFDVMSLWAASSRRCVLRVKTTSNHSAVWTVKKSGKIFLDQQDDDDFVVIVDIGAGLRDRDIYLVPTGELLKCLENDHAHYVSHPKKDGTPRKSEQGMRNIRLYGSEQTTDHSRGYHEKFSEYREAWNQLK